MNSDSDDASIDNLDIKILKVINKKRKCSDGYLVSKFGENVEIIVNDLLRNTCYITREYTEKDREDCLSGNGPLYGSGDLMLTKQGEIFLKRCKYGRQLKGRELWAERIFSFISGVALTALAWGLSTFWS